MMSDFPLFQPNASMNGRWPINRHHDLHEFEVWVPGNTVPTHLNGVSVEIWVRGQFVGTTTIGGFLLAGEDEYALTVAHVFCSHRDSSPSPFVFDEAELDFLVPFDSGQEQCQLLEEQEESKACSVDSLSIYDADSDTRPNIAEVYESRKIPVSEKVGKIMIGRLSHMSGHGIGRGTEQPRLDWALVAIDYGSVTKTNKVPPLLSIHKHTVSQADVAIVLSDETVVATIVSTSAFGLPISAPPQPVLVANIFLGSVSPGSSGSWAFRTGEVDPMGMLVGACNRLSECYLLSMTDLQEDIERQTGFHTTITCVDSAERRGTAKPIFG